MDQARLLHIHTAVRTGRPMVSSEFVVAITDQGIEGDRYATGLGKYSRSPGARGITLFPIETIREMQSQHGPDLLVHEHRRNLTTEGIDPNDLIGQKFTIGDVTLEGLRPCQPCRYLNMMSKKQVSTLLANRAGVFCQVVSGGTLKVGDLIQIT
ncbi:MOSC domain-containing protein [Shimia sp.]|uniref:MOSC domain-containing protein n=1 Tax=Shimia sp. TaxID=1954381 RepID=UPI0032979C44